MKGPLRYVTMDGNSSEDVREVMVGMWWALGPSEIYDVCVFEAGLEWEWNLLIETGGGANVLKEGSGAWILYLENGWNVDEIDMTDDTVAMLDSRQSAWIVILQQSY